jgi:CheY-like chemotaxis protein
MRTRRKWLPEIAAVAFSLGGVALSVYLFTYFRQQERSSAMNQLENTCELKGSELQNQFAAGVTIMVAMRQLYLKTPGMTNDQWNAAAVPLIRTGNWPILSMSRSEFVRRAELTRWERAAGTTVKEVNQSTAALVPVSPSRALYLPIANTYPATTRILGLDNLSEPARKDAALRAERMGSLAVSEPFVAPNVNPTGRGAQRAFLLCLPIRAGGGAAAGVVSSAYFEYTVLPGRFGSGLGFAFGIGQSVLFTDVGGDLRAMRSFPLGDKAIQLICSAQSKVGLAPILIASLGSALSVLLPVVAVWLARQQRARAKALQEEGVRAEGLRVKSILLSRVSHELRTPLHGLMATLEGHADSPDGSRRDEAAETALRALHSLEEMVDNLIEYAAFEAGNAVMELTDASVSELLQGVATRMTWADLRGNTLALTPTAANARLRIDKRRVTRCICLLLSDALKRAESGRLTVDIEPDFAAQTLLFSLITTGRVPETAHGTMLSEEGLGLGLLVAGQILDLVGATKDVTSLDGAGTRVTVTFPASDVRASAPAVSGPTVHPSTMSEETRAPRDLALVVDDNALNRRVLCSWLNQMECDTVEAVDGQDAVNKFIPLRETGAPRIIFMDIEMPIMNGLKASTELRKNGYTGPIVAVTANSVDLEMQNYKAHGIDTWQTKPLKKTDILATLESARSTRHAPS